MSATVRKRTINQRDLTTVAHDIAVSLQEYGNYKRGKRTGVKLFRIPLKPKRDDHSQK